MKFSEKIIILRKIKGITQDEFANAVGVSRQAVYKWECGQSYPEALKLIEIKALFGISIDDLLDDNYEIALPEKKKRKRIPKVKVEKAAEEKPVAEKAPEVIEKTPEVEAEPVVEVVSEAETVVNDVVTKEAEISKTVTDEAEKIIEEIAEEKPNEEPAYENVSPVVDEEKPLQNEKQEVKKRGFFSRLFGRK